MEQTILSERSWNTNPGERHSNIQSVFDNIEHLLDTSTVDASYKTKLSINFSKMQSAFKAFTETTKKRKPIFLMTLNKSIGEWNKYIHANRKHVGPFLAINTKYHACNSTTQKMLDLGIDTINDDKDQDGNFISSSPGSSIVLCKKGKKLCCGVPIDTLVTMLGIYFNDSSSWKFNREAMFRYFKGCDRTMPKVVNLSKCLSLKCPQRSETGEICNQLIPLGKLMQHLPAKEKAKYTGNRIWRLLVKVLPVDWISFCPDSRCRYSELGFLTFQKTPMVAIRDNIDCSFCSERHYVHAHKTTCPNVSCLTTFCRVCKISPYHESSICQGPCDNADMDPETYKTICETTKPCPYCRARVSKLNGCDKILCGNCKVYWCWRCLQLLDQKNPYYHQCISEDIIEGRQDGAYHDVGNWNQERQDFDYEEDNVNVRPVRRNLDLEFRRVVDDEW